MPRLRVMVADDQPLIRIGLSEFLRQLSEDIEQVEAKDIDDAMSLVSKGEQFDLIITDLILQGMQGFEGLRRLHQAAPDVPIVVLTVKDGAGDVRGAIDAGAMGYIPKTSSPEVMINALKLVLSGGVYLPPNVLGAESTQSGERLGRVAAVGAEGGLGLLTPRQREVLALLAQGKTNKQIADELGLAAGTVKVHMSRILKALNVHNRTQAVIAASELTGTGPARAKH